MLEDYKRITEVRASVVDDSAQIVLEDGTTVEFTQEMASRSGNNLPRPGDMWRVLVQTTPATVDIPEPTVTVKDAQPIPAHIQRMLDEQGRVNGDIAKLSAFIDTNPLFLTLPEQERVDMYSQLSGMATHAFHLGRRLARVGF